MTRGTMISIALLALIALLLIVLFGRQGGAGTIDKGKSKTQTNGTNIAKECATTCSSIPAEATNLSTISARSRWTITYDLPQC
jgi:hypothetical protein